MVVADPSAELLDLVRSLGDPAPATAPVHLVRRAELVRRRFGVALPPPFAAPPGPDDPIRPATAFDGAAIAAVKWRVFGTSYRGGVLPDDFLDRREVVPPPSFWVGRAMVPPSRRHRLLVWGRPGAVHGYIDTGPLHVSPGPGEADAADLPHPADLPDIADTSDGSDPGPGPGSEETTSDRIGEVYELYVDPAAQHLGGGARLLAAGREALARAGFACAELSVLSTNSVAHAFYRSQGWAPTGRIVHVDLGVVAFDEVRFSDCGSRSGS